MWYFPGGLNITLAGGIIFTNTSYITITITIINGITLKLVVKPLNTKPSFRTIAVTVSLECCNHYYNYN